MSFAKTVLSLTLTVLGLTFAMSPAMAAGSRKHPPVIKKAKTEVVPESNESILRRALATSSSIGTGSYSCVYALETPPLEIAPAPGKFELSALAVTKKTSEFKVMFTAEPTFETIVLRDQKILKATFSAVQADQQSLQVVIRIDESGRIFEIDGETSPTQDVFRCF